MRILGDKPNMELFFGVIAFIVIISLGVPFIEKLTNPGGAKPAAGHDVIHYKQLDWKFDGIAGKFDIPAIQRGYQVYREVCATCHGMKRIAFRNLQQIGFTETQVKQLASEAAVTDGPDDAGNMFVRPGIPSDYFQNPFANENAARAANGGAYPPDLSLMVKARPDGANYLYSLLMGYDTPPLDFKLSTGKYYNKYFAGHQISMPPPIDNEIVEYTDGTLATKDQIAKDVVNFLQWAAEPEMEQRKSIGVKAISYILLLFVLFYYAKKRIWKDVKK